MSRREGSGEPGHSSRLSRLRRRRPLLIGAALLLVLGGGVAALAQETPESLLPPGFGGPPAPAGNSAQPAAPDAAPAADPAPDPLENEALANVEDAAEDALIEPAGPFDSGRLAAGYGADAFGRADGRYLATLMRRLDAPIASRWAEILLRRLLLTPVPTPAGVSEADWIAERASLLLRLGEADGARMLVAGAQGRGTSRRLRVIAARTALATADPAALCGLPDSGEVVGGQPTWPLVRAMCAGLSGEPAVANLLVARARYGRGEEIDRALAEKVAGAGGLGRRAVQIDWTPVGQLNVWRFGLASALAVPIPDALMASAPPWFRAWQARAPMLPLEQRIRAAETAAALGPFSSAALVDLYGQAMDDSGEVDTTSRPGLLRTAYVGDDDGARVRAMRALWEAPAKENGDERARYAASILTARAAARIAPEDRGDDVPALLAAMLSAGLDRQAERWAGVVEGMDGTAGERAWALLAVGATRPVVTSDLARLTRFAEQAGSEGRQRTALLAAALAAFGRLPAADAGKWAGDQGVPLGRVTPYTRALDRAVMRRERGTVALLAAVGMQTQACAAIPAPDLYAMLRALRRVGLAAEARMIAAEVMTRT